MASICNQNRLKGVNLKQKTKQVSPGYAQFHEIAFKYYNGFLIERFHSLVQRLCKVIGTKESVYIRKELNSHRNVLEHQYGGCDVICMKTLYKCASGKTLVHLREINCKLQSLVVDISRNHVGDTTILEPGTG